MDKKPTFAQVAEALGEKGIRLGEPGDFREGLAAALAHDGGPVVVDAVVDPSALHYRLLPGDDRSKLDLHDGLLLDCSTDLERELRKLHEEIVPIVALVLSTMRAAA